MSLNIYVNYRFKNQWEYIMPYDNIIYLAVEDKIKLITIAKHNWHENIASDKDAQHL